MRRAYLAKLDALDREVREAIAQNPAKPPQGDLDPRCVRLFGRRLRHRVHCALGGFHRIRAQRARDRGDYQADQGLENTGGFPENISDERLIRRISAETGVRVGGTLFSDSLTGEKGDAPTYIDMVRHNIKALTSALSD